MLPEINKYLDVFFVIMMTNLEIMMNILENMMKFLKILDAFSDGFGRLFKPSGGLLLNRRSGMLTDIYSSGFVETGKMGTGKGISSASRLRAVPNCPICAKGLTPMTARSNRLFSTWAPA